MKLADDWAKSSFSLVLQVATFVLSTKQRQTMQPTQSVIRLLRQAASGLIAVVMAIACSTNAQTVQPDVAAANAALGRAFYEEGFNAKTATARTTAITRIVSPDYIQHNSIAPPGRDGLIGFETAISQSFPDVKATVLDVFATNDRVVVRWTFTGTLTGQPFLGISATGQKLDFDIIDIWTVKNGQLYEHWDQLDWPRALVLLGVKGLPAPFVDAAGKPVNR